MHKIVATIIWLSAGIAVIVLIGFTALQLKSDLERGKKHEGFTYALPGKDIYALDFQGGDVICGGADGLFRVNSETLETEEIEGFSYVKAILATEDGLWIGSDRGVALLGTSERFTTEKGLPDNRVLSLFRRRDGAIWIGTWGGAAELRAENGLWKLQKTYTAADGLANDMVNVIYEDSFGGMWFGSYVAPRGGVGVLDGGNNQIFTIDSGLPHANVSVIIETSAHSVIVGGGLYTRGGAAEFERVNGQWALKRVVAKTDGLAGEKVRSLYEDSAGRLWFGSEYDGLAVFDGRHRLILNTETGLGHNEVKVIREGADGSFWIGTNGGLTKISPQVINSATGQ